MPEQLDALAPRAVRPGDQPRERGMQPQTMWDSGRGSALRELLADGLTAAVDALPAEQRAVVRAHGALATDEP